MVRLTAKERIEKVVCWAGLSTNAFAIQIGLSSPQTLYQIKSEKHQISRPLAERICTRYPEVDFRWLLTGEGEMLRPQERQIPFYDIDCAEVALGAHHTPSGLVAMPHCGECDFVAPYNLRDMEPAIKQGSMLFCKRCEVEDVRVGDIVVVSCARKAMVRKVAGVGEAELLLGTESSEPHIVRLDVTLIKAIYEVVAVLEWKNR